MTDSKSNMVKAFLFNLHGFDSSPDDEQDYDNQDNLSDEEADPASVDHLPDHMPYFANALHITTYDRNMLYEAPISQ